MASLADRYIHAVTSQLPEESRAEVTRELRATIEDSIEAKGPAFSRAAAEREALLELGAPTSLATGYRGRPLALIGPEVYPAWLRILKFLLLIIPPLAAASSLIIQLLADRSLNQAIGSMLSTALFAAIQVFFWVTLGFAIVERQGLPVPPFTAGRTWTPEQLPELEPATYSVSESVGNLITNAVMATLLATAVNPTLTAADESKTLLFTDGAMSWRWFLVAIAVLGILLEIGQLAWRPWVKQIALANLFLGCAFFAPILWLFEQRQLFTADASTIIDAGIRMQSVLLGVIITAAVVLGISLWSVVRAFRKG